MDYASEQPEFEESIANSRKVFTYILRNKFNDAQKMIDQLPAEKCLYHSITESNFACLQAICTYEQELIDIAHDKIKRATEVCATFRKRHTLGETVSNWWVGETNFADFSELELHAELCYAECLLSHAILTFIQDEHFMRFIEGGLKIRSSYNTFRYCMQVIKNKPQQLSNSRHAVDFESGVYMGMGIFNVLLSLLPPSIMRLLEWVGFRGDRSDGLDWLDKGFRIGGLRSPVCSMALLSYYLILQPSIGIFNTDGTYESEIIQRELLCYRDSSIYIYYSARLQLSQGLIEEAMSEYNKAVSVHTDWQQVRHISYWGMTWCLGYQGKWRLAAQCAETLSIESKWSKCTYHYLHAAFLMMEKFELQHSGDNNKVEDAEALSESIENLLNNVKKHKQRIAGKSIPFENLAVARVEKYQVTGKLIIPGLESIYIWNGFTVMSHDVEILKHFLSLIELALEESEQSEESEAEHHHHTTLCLLLKGACLRRLKRTQEAEDCLTLVASSFFPTGSCQMDTYVAPYASAELGAIYADNGETERAIAQYEHTLTHYSKYGLESRLHFRLHNRIAALREIKCSAERTSRRPSDEASDEEFFDAHQAFQVETS